jgi:hypothetical protein
MLDAQSKKILHFFSYFSHHKQAIAKVLRANAAYLYYAVAVKEVRSLPLY